MRWDIKHEDAMAEARRSGIPPEDADTVWLKYNELGARVDAGELADADALKQFGEFCSRLARMRTLRTLMSPDLDVINGPTR